MTPQQEMDAAVGIFIGAWCAYLHPDRKSEETFFDFLHRAFAPGTREHLSEIVDGARKRKAAKS